MSLPRVILVDDHALFRTGLRQLLEAAGIATVVAEASNGEEFLDALGDADVVFMDIDMPVMGGVEATRHALAMKPDLKVIALSMHGDEHYYFAMVEAGAKGFLLKNSGIDEVAAAMATVVEGGTYFARELLEGLVGMLHAKPTSDGLSERELEILLMVCAGLQNAEIAAKLFISKRTVDKHRANILQKTGSRNTANLVVYAIKNGLVEL